MQVCWSLFSCIFLLTVSAGEQLADAKPVTKAQATRKVVAAIILAVQADSDARGDVLTTSAIRAAAEAAGRLPEDLGRQAFLLGLGIGLDDSMILRGNPLTSRFCNEVESDDDRKRRLKIIGKRPTMQGRRDWAQHFAVSCFLTEMFGPNVAEAAGIYKEQMDTGKGGTGFSFGDINADLAGIILAKNLKKGTITLPYLARRFEIKSFLPEGKSLKEDLTSDQFKSLFGSMEDERYRKEIAKIRRRIEELEVYQKK